MTMHMTLEDDFDSWHRRLKSAVHHIPGARAVGISRFLIAFPKDHPGANFYFPDLADDFFHALSDPTFRLPDPALREEVRLGVEVLASAGLVDLGLLLAAEASLTVRPLSESIREERPDERTVHAWIPVVQEIVDRRGALPSHVGTVKRLYLYPRMWGDERPEIRHTGRVEAEETARLEPLIHVAQRALLASKQLAPSHGLRATIERWVRSVAHTRPVFDFSIGETEALVAGPSAGLALAVAFLGALTAFKRNGVGFRPSSRLAWTGAMASDPHRIRSVGDGPSLRAKIRAAYFEGLEGIVVPREQLAAAEAAVPPGSHPFTVRGVDSLEEILVDKSFISPWRVPSAIRFQPRSRVSRRERVLQLALLMGLVLAALGIVNLLWGSRTYAIPRTHDRWILILQRGFRFPMLHHDDARIYRHAYGHGLAGNHTGDRLVVLRQYSAGLSPSSAHPTQLQVFSLPSLSWRPQLLWWYDFVQSGLPFDPLADRPDALYGPVGLAIADLDGAPGKEIVSWTSAHPYSSTLISVWNGERYPVAAAVHPGMPSEDQPLVADVNGDDGSELVITNYGNAVGGTSVLIMRFRDFCPTDSVTTARHAHGKVAERSRTRRPSPPHRTFDREQQPCLANFTIPVPDSIYSFNPTDTFQSRGLHLLPRQWSVWPFTFSISALAQSPEDDYIVTLGAPDKLVALTVNAIGLQRAILVGHPYVGTQQFVDEWKQLIRVYDHICWDSTDTTGRPVVTN